MFITAVNDDLQFFDNVGYFSQNTVQGLRKQNAFSSITHRPTHSNVY